MIIETNMKCKKCGDTIFAGIESESECQLRVYVCCENDDCEYRGSEFVKYLDYHDFE